MSSILFINSGLVVAGTVSTGGLAALATKIVRKRPDEITADPNERSISDVAQRN